MREHWQSGLEDTRRTLKRRDWLAMPEQGMGIVVHDVHRERDYLKTGRLSTGGRQSGIGLVREIR